MGVLPPSLALLAGLSPHVVAVADMTSPGESAWFLRRADSRGSRVRGGGPGILSLQFPFLHNVMLRRCLAGFGHGKTTRRLSAAARTEPQAALV